MKLSKITFLFIACSLMLLPLEQIEFVYVERIKQVLCAILILTFGISHGAIDNLLYGQRYKLKTGPFMLRYVFLMGVTAMLWFIMPEAAIFLFLAISAYHFGQSQFDELSIQSNLRPAIYTFWGMALILALIHFNKEEITQMLAGYHYLDGFIFDALIQYSQFLWLVNTFLAFGLLAYQVHKSSISIQEFFIQGYIFALIVISFLIYDIIVGFTLYFIILHSMKVLVQEYDFLKMKGAVTSRIQFVKLLLPFTVLSLTGTGIIYGAVQYFSLDISIPLLALLIVSCITVPHSIVMHVFYSKLQA